MRAIAYLALSMVLLLFANGRHTIAPAMWLAPLFLLRFVRVQRPPRGLAIAWLVLMGAFAFQFRGMAPLPPIGYFVLSAVFGLVEVLPFVADRLLVPKERRFAGTLVFPCAWVLVEYLVATFTPYGSWGAAAYSQHENLALLQIVSLTGLYGISFLIAWFASVANWAWERGFAWGEIRQGALAFVVILAAVQIFGAARLAIFPPDAGTVRIASLTRPDIELIPDPEIAQRIFGGTATAEDLGGVRDRANALNDDLLLRSRREARAGAKIVFWGETNGFVFKEDEPALLERGADLARSERIYLGLGIGTWNGSSPKPLENKLVLIDPSGEIVWENWKAIPVPGGEAAISALDDGRIKTADTPHGRIGAVICFDMDFPRLLRQAGRSRADLMLVPSNDWKEIDPWHSHMARFRAVEQGFNLVRHTSGGLSIATDYQGRVLDTMDHYTTTEDRVLLSHVPTRGTRTVYSVVGDLFAWLCMLALPVVAVLTRRHARNVKRPDVLRTAA